MDVARKHYMDCQVKDKCGNRIVKIILERVQQVTASEQKKTKSHETLSSRNMCPKSQDGSLRNNASRRSSEPSSGSCLGSINRPKCNSSTEDDDDITSDESDSNSESNETSDDEFQPFPLKQEAGAGAKSKTKSSKKLSTHAVLGKTRHPQTQTESIPCLECDLCFKKFQSLFALEKHVIRFHVVDKPFECDICCKSFLTEQRLRRHRQRIHKQQNEEKPFKCDICCKSYLTEKLVRKHKRRIHKNQDRDKPFECTICCKSYSTELLLRRHRRRFHKHQDGNKPFECTICSKSYSTELLLWRHRRRIHKHQKSPVVDKPFECDICNKSFPTEFRLRRHIQRTHKQKNPQKQVNKINSISWLQCDLCRYKCTSQKELEYHTFQVHVVDKPFKCEICIKSFMTDRGLKDHVRLTHANKSFNCKLCPAQFFKDTASLKKHAELVHKSCSDHRDSETSGDTKLFPVYNTGFLTDSDLAKHSNTPSVPVDTPCGLNLHRRQNIHNEIPVEDASRKNIKLEGIVESHHEKQGPHSEKIPKSFASVKHQVSPQKFSCSACSAFFSCHSDLDLHELQEKHQLTSNTSSLNGNETELTLIKQEVDVKYFGDNSSDFENPPEPTVSVVKLEFILEQ